MKNNTSLNVFFSVALGSLVGTIASLQFSLMFWWAGLIIGGVVGYIAYDFKKVTQAVPKAWKMATSIKVKKPDKEIWFFRIIYIFSFSGAIYSCLSLIASLLILGEYLLHGNKSSFLSDYLIPSTAIYILVFIVIALDAFLMKVDNPKKFVFAFDNGSRKGYKLTPLEIVTIFGLTPLTTPITVVCLAIVGIFLLAIKIFRSRIIIGNYIKKATFFIAVTIWVSLGKFLWYLFKLVHNDVRAICFIDAVIGSIIGYSLESPLIGCLAGGTFGWFNYKVVALILLKLQPKHS